LGAAISIEIPARLQAGVAMMHGTVCSREQECNA
jgi:hypothetical protein